MPLGKPVKAVTIGCNSHQGEAVKSLYLRMGLDVNRLAIDAERRLLQGFREGGMGVHHPPYFTAGARLNLSWSEGKSFGFDYAFQDLGQLDSVHRFTLALNF